MVEVQGCSACSQKLKGVDVAFRCSDFEDGLPMLLGTLRSVVCWVDIGSVFQTLLYQVCVSDHVP